MARGTKVEISEQERAEVERLAGFLRHEDIALVTKINIKTLQRKCKDELKRGKAAKKEEIMDTLFSMARKETFPAINIFLGKTLCGLRERDKIKSGEVPKDQSALPKKLPPDPIEAAKVYQKIMTGI